jgi:hypothetical protein
MVIGRAGTRAGLRTAVLVQGHRTPGGGQPAGVSVEIASY